MKLSTVVLVFQRVGNTKHLAANNKKQFKGNSGGGEVGREWNGGIGWIRGQVIDKLPVIRDQLFLNSPPHKQLVLALINS